MAPLRGGVNGPATTEEGGGKERVKFNRARITISVWLRCQKAK